MTDVTVDAPSREGLAMSVISNIPDIEGDPVQFLRVSEAYWQAGFSDMSVLASSFSWTTLNNLTASAMYDICAMQCRP